MSLPSAISAMLIYRLISWIFIAVIGWAVFFFMFRTESEIDPEAEPAEASDLSAAESQGEEVPPMFSPDSDGPHEPEN